MGLLARLGIGGGGGNYAYVTARVRAKKASLLEPETYAKLLAMDLPEISRFIEEREYKREVDELAGRFKGARLIEAATRLNLGRTYQDVLSYCTGGLRSLVELYLQRYDVYNIKTVLRGRFAGASEDEVSVQLIPAAVLSTQDLQDLLKLANLEEVVDALTRTPYGEVLKGTLAEGRVTNLAAAENALDQRYYRMLLAAIPAATEAHKAFRNFVRREIDVVNMRTVLRLRADGVEDPGDVLVPGGNEVGEDRARRLLRSSNDELVHELEGTSLSGAAGDGIRESLATGDLNPAASALDRYLLTSAFDFGHRYPLSILPVVDFVLRKRREVDNLRAIAFGKQASLAEETIKALVIQ